MTTCTDADAMNLSLVAVQCSSPDSSKPLLLPGRLATSCWPQHIHMLLKDLARLMTVFASSGCTSCVGYTTCVNDPRYVCYTTGTQPVFEHPCRLEQRYKPYPARSTAHKLISSRLAPARAHQASFTAAAATCRALASTAVLQCCTTAALQPRACTCAGSSLCLPAQGPSGTPQLT